MELWSFHVEVVLFITQSCAPTCRSQSEGGLEVPAASKASRFADRSASRDAPQVYVRRRAAASSSFAISDPFLLQCWQTIVFHGTTRLR